jgi:hypothetical protein
VALTDSAYRADIGYGIYLVRRRNVLGFAIAFYLVNLLLVCNLIFNIGGTMGERLIYHSSVGFAIATAYLMYLLSVRLKPACIRDGFGVSY